MKRVVAISNYAWTHQYLNADHGSQERPQGRTYGHRYIISRFDMLEPTIFACTGTWNRDFEMGMERETVKFTIRNETFEEERLELFDNHMSYNILMYICLSYNTCMHVCTIAEIHVHCHVLLKQACMNINVYIIAHKRSYNASYDLLSTGTAQIPTVRSTIFHRRLRWNPCGNGLARPKETDIRTHVLARW